MKQKYVDRLLVEKQTNIFQMCSLCTGQGDLVALQNKAHKNKEKVCVRTTSYCLQYIEYKLTKHYIKVIKLFNLGKAINGVGVVARF